MVKIMKNNSSQIFPREWKTEKLVDVFDVLNGLWVGKTEDVVLCNVLRNTNFSNDGYIDTEDIASLNVDKKSLSSRILKLGDIIIEKSGGSDVQPVGRVVFFDINNDIYSFSNFTSCLRTKEGYYSKFYFYFLYNFWLNGKTRELQRQTTGIRNLDFNAYLNLDLPVPKIEEQRRIAEILSMVDNKIKKIDEVLFKTEELKKGLMRDLFTGGINHDVFKKTKVGSLPQEWEVLKMKDICTVRQGLQIAISKRFKDYQPGRYKYITLKNIKDGTYEYIESPKKTVICEKDDVLMTRTGNTGVVVTNVEGVFHNNFFLIDFDRNRIIKDYLVYYFLRNEIKKIVLEKAGTTTIPDLNHGAFYNIDFVLPSLVEQKKIVNILTALDKKISTIKRLKTKTIDLKKGLMSDLLSGKVRTK